MYKVLTGKYDLTVVPKLQLATSFGSVFLRGYFLKLATLHPKYNTSKYSFIVISVKLWNSLQNHVKDYYYYRVLRAI